jgi:hypothetical protein
MILHIYCRLSQEAVFMVEDHISFSETLGTHVSESVSDVLEDLQIKSAPIDPEKVSTEVMNRVSKKFLDKFPDLSATGFFEDQDTFVVDISTSRYIHAPSTRLH